MKWLKRSAALFLFLIAMLGILEWVLRHKINGYHTQRLPQQMIDQHTRLGFVYEPDLMWYWENLPSEYAGVNALGLRRNKSMKRTKPPEITRVIAFGDSQTYGGGVETEETFSYYAEEKLGGDWEVLNAGMSGYRSLNIFRLMRKKMLPLQPDMFLIDCMMWDSPAEDGQLHEEFEAKHEDKLREWLWNSRLNFVFQTLLRSAGIGIWQDLPWPIHLHKIKYKQRRKGSEGYGNHDQIARWAIERDIVAVFMEYPIQNGGGNLECLSEQKDLPQPSFPTCQVLKDSGYPPSELFIDTNHLKPLGAQIIGEALAQELPKIWAEHRPQP